MARTLMEQQALDAAAVFLVVGENAETVTFYPAHGGASRPVVMEVSGGARPEPGAIVDQQEDTVTVFCLKDETHAKGGVAVPVHDQGSADSFQRDGDPDHRKFVFNGRIIMETDHSWQLEYTRPRPIRAGGNARR